MGACLANCLNILSQRVIYQSIPNGIIEEAEKIDINSPEKIRGLIIHDRIEENDRHDYVVLLLINDGHASILIIDNWIFEILWGTDISFGYLLNFFNMQFRSLQQTPEGQTILMKPFLQYHVYLSGNTYKFGKHLQYFPRIIHGDMYYISKITTDIILLEILLTACSPKNYRLIESDCLEYCKKVTKVICLSLNDLDEENINAFLEPLNVTETTAEIYSRNNRSYGSTAANAYGSTFPFMTSSS